MTGHGSANRDVGRLNVTNFTDHDHVRVLAQNVAETAGKGELDFRFNVHLQNAGQLVLNRFFDGNDPPLHRIDAAEETVKRSRLATPGWTGEKNNTVRLGEQMPDDVFLFRTHIQPVKTKLLSAAAE